MYSILYFGHHSFLLDVLELAAEERLDGNAGLERANFDFPEFGNDVNAVKQINSALDKLEEYAKRENEMRQAVITVMENLEVGASNINCERIYDADTQQSLQALADLIGYKQEKGENNE